MYQTIRASELGTYNTCPFKLKYGNTEEDYKPKVLFFGDIVHAAARHDNVQPLIDYFSKNISTDHKLKLILQKATKKVRQYVLKRVKEAEENGWTIYYELKMIVVFKEKLVVVTGTPDMIIVKQDEVEVVDFKTAIQRALYKTDDIREESMQPSVYCTMSMLYFNKSKASFTYFVLEKTNSVPTVEVSRDIVNESIKIAYLIDERKKSNETGVRPALQSRMCWSCPLKKSGLCPVWNKQYTNILSEVSSLSSDIEELDCLSIGDYVYPFLSHG